MRYYKAQCYAEPAIQRVEVIRENEATVVIPDPVNPAGLRCAKDSRWVHFRKTWAEAKVALEQEVQRDLDLAQRRVDQEAARLEKVRQLTNHEEEL